MARYDMWLYTDKGVRIHDKVVHDREKGAKYDPAGISGKLACVVMDCLKNSPYLGTMKARVTACGHRTEFMLLLKNDTLDVYCHAGKFTRAKEQNSPKRPSRAAAPPAKEGVA